jgi:CheY-like chemotaxis protein
MDEIDTLNLLEKFFGLKHPEIVCKFSRVEVGLLEEINENPPKVIITEYFLPRISGVEICKYIKSNPKLKHIYVFYYTTMPEERLKSIVEETGADGYIHMPATFSDFDVILDLLKKNK